MASRFFTGTGTSEGPEAYQIGKLSKIPIFVPIMFEESTIFSYLLATDVLTVTIMHTCKVPFLL